MGARGGAEKSLQRGADSSPPAPSRGAVPADGSGVPSPVSPPASPRNVGAGASAGGRCSRQDAACPGAARGPAASQRRAAERSKPLARGGSSPGETEAAVGKAGMGAGVLLIPRAPQGAVGAPARHGELRPGELRSRERGSGGGASPPGSQVLWQSSGTPGAAGAALARGSFGGRWCLASPEPAQCCGVHGGHQLGWGTQPRGGGPGKVPPGSATPCPGLRPARGRGRPGGSGCQLGSTPATKAAQKARAE